MTGADLLKESARVYLAAVKSERLRESLDSWVALPGLPPIDTFHEHVGHTWGVRHWNYSMFDLAPHFLYTGWSQGQRGRLESLDMDGDACTIMCCYERWSYKVYN